MPWSSAPRPGACAPPSTCGRASPSPPTTRPARSRACCSRRIAPAAFPRPSRPSGASWWPTSSSSCAVCRRSPVGAPSARPWRASAAVPSTTSLNELRRTPRPGGLPLAHRPAIALGQPAQGALPGALADRLARLLREALALQRRGGELDDRVGQRVRVGRAQAPGDAVLEDRAGAALGHRDDRQPAGLGLEEDLPEGVGTAGEEEEGGARGGVGTR